MAYPNSAVLLDAPPSLMASFDPDRLAQVVSNLLSNARNHGLIGEPIWVQVIEHAHCATLSVANLAPPIADAQIGGLFDPFKAHSVDNVRNPGGLGLGLYIASEVAKGHRGSLAYSHDGTRVMFTMTLPQLPDSSVLEHDAAAGKDVHGHDLETIAGKES